MTEDNRGPDAKRKAKYRKKQAEEQAWFDKKMGEMPKHIRELLDSVEGNITGQSRGQEPWERAPNHLVKHDLYDDENAEPYIDIDMITAELTNKATASKSDKKALTKSELKNKYPKLWGKRGAPKVIVGLELEASTHEDDKINVRTIQRYFKEDREDDHN
jgi:hypothetical protein